MQIGPRYKICKRLGSGVFEKCQTQQFEVSKSRGGKKSRRRRRQSNYGAQLEEKQKVRYSYGIREKQFRGYVNKAVSQRDRKPVNSLFQQLETRLDNVVYRMGFARTRQMARQLVVHGHICVNGKRVNVPSHLVKTGDRIHVRKESQDKGPFLEAKEVDVGSSVPGWVVVDRSELSGTIQAVPNYDPTTEIFDLISVIEFYNR